MAENFKGTQQYKFHSLFTVKLPFSPQGAKLSQDKNIVLPHPSCGTGKIILETLKKETCQQEKGKDTEEIWGEPAAKIHNRTQEKN